MTEVKEHATQERRAIHIAKPVIGDAEKKAVIKPLEDGWLTQGPQVAEFEKVFAKGHDVKHAIATTSCTTGLYLATVA